MNGNSDDSPSYLTFRVHPTDEDDQCKSIVRISRKYMRQLGIKECNVVKLSSGTKSTAAACLALDEDRNYVTHKNVKIHDIEIEYKGEDLSEKQDPYPKIRISNLVHSHLGSGWNPTSLVNVSRFEDDPDSSSSGDPEDSAATVIKLGTLEIFEKMMPGYKDQLDWNDALDMLIQKDDKVSISFKDGSFAEQRKTEKQQQEQFRQQWKQKMETGNTRPSRPPRPLPRCFSSIVLDVKPEGKPFWSIGNDTKFEFQDIDSDVLEPGFKLKPKNLTRVIPIARQIHVDGIKITMASLEIYENMMKMIFYSELRIKMSESDFANPDKVDRMTSMLDEPRFVIALSDDLENSYPVASENGGTRRTGPDLSTKEAVSEQEWYQFLQPVLDPNAKKLKISIKEIQWLKRNQEGIDELHSDMRTSVSSSPSETNMPQEHYPPGKLVIIEGPWEFRIPVGLVEK